MNYRNRCAVIAREKFPVHDQKHVGYVAAQSDSIISWMKWMKMRTGINSFVSAITPGDWLWSVRRSCFSLMKMSRTQNGPVELMNELCQTHNDSAKIRLQKLMNLMSCCNVRRGVNNSMLVRVWRRNHVYIFLDVVRNKSTSRPEKRVVFVVIANSQTMTTTSVFSMVFALLIVIRWQCVEI